MRASEDRFRSLVQNSSDTTLILGDEARITYASPATTSLLGLSPDEVLSMPATDLVHPEDQARVETQLAALLQTSSVTEPIQFRIAHADGSYRHVEVVVSDVRDNPSVAGIDRTSSGLRPRSDAVAGLA